MKMQIKEICNRFLTKNHEFVAVKIFIEEDPEGLFFIKDIYFYPKHSKYEALSMEDFEKYTKTWLVMRGFWALIEELDLSNTDREIYVRGI